MTDNNNNNMREVITQIFSVDKSLTYTILDYVLWQDGIGIADPDRCVTFNNADSKILTNATRICTLSCRLVA